MIQDPGMRPASWCVDGPFDVLADGVGELLVVGVGRRLGRQLQVGEEALHEVVEAGRGRRGRRPAQLHQRLLRLRQRVHGLVVFVAQLAVLEPLRPQLLVAFGQRCHLPKDQNTKTQKESASSMM